MPKSYRGTMHRLCPACSCSRSDMLQAALVTRVHWKTTDGLTLVGESWGNAEGPSVVLPQGGGQTRHSWARAAKSLASAGYFALVLDLRGHGESDWAPDGDY